MARIADLFRQTGVERFYVWLSPGPRMEIVRGWLTDAGMTRRPHVSYPTLARAAVMKSRAAGRVDAREMDGSEAARLAERHEGIAWPDYLRSAGAPGFHHFMAFDGGRPIATAVLCILDDLGYLGTALTAEPFRGRGAQQAIDRQADGNCRHAGLPNPRFRDTVVPGGLPGQLAESGVQGDLREGGV
jgi:hypothetical protein